MSVAFVFPGQGSQAPRMGLDWVNSPDAANDLYGWSSACLGWDLVKTLETASPDELRQTYIAQPAIFCVSVAALQALQRAGIQPAFVAGHSLGEFSALVAAGALSFEAGLTLVARRAEAMQRAADASPGSMTSVLGLSVEGVEMAVAAARGHEVLAIANDNAPGNVVVSGAWPALERLPAAAKELGAKRVLPLNVGGAFHSPLMAPAAEMFRSFLTTAPFRDPLTPMVSNATAEPTTSADELRELLARQLTGPVRWTESVRRMAELGVTTFIEVGPGTVLSGLIKRTVDGVRVLSAGDAESVAGVVEALRERSEGPTGDGDDQGEVVMLPERFAVSPSHGRFYPVDLSRQTDEGPYVEPGDLLGEVRNGAASVPVRSPFRGQVVAHLAWEGELVTPGQILLSLRPF
ncbi:MAG TPA: ACP S-malonyltransferase [Actinomycetes bacterium]|jgi:[acyl-carrier-protein] S-malonyltransferase|nr:ACP S-malonyltransferase [Actinomycetes bacterium]